MYLFIAIFFNIKLSDLHHIYEIVKIKIEHALNDIMTQDDVVNVLKISLFHFCSFARNAQSNESLN